MDRAGSAPDKYLNFGFKSLRVEVQKCLKSSKTNETEIHLVDRMDGDFRPDHYLAQHSVGVRRNRTFHRHSEIELVLVEKGRLGNLVGGEVVWLHPGRLAAFWGAVPHTLVGAVPGTIYNWLTVPFSWFLEWRLPPQCNEAILAGKMLQEPDAQDAPADLALFSRWHRDLRDVSPDLRKVVLLESEARLRRLLRRAIAATGERRATDASPGSSGIVERMTRFVASHYSETLRIADIAGQVGLHPNYAAALFRRTCGVGLLDYIKEYRIYHAQRLLATTDQKILKVAIGAGFGSASRFYCAFQKTCGTTPRAYRHGMAGLLGDSGTNPDPGAAFRLSNSRSDPGDRSGGARASR